MTLVPSILVGPAPLGLAASALTSSVLPAASASSSGTPSLLLLLTPVGPPEGRDLDFVLVVLPNRMDSGCWGG